MGGLVVFLNGFYSLPPRSTVGGGHQKAPNDSLAVKCQFGLKILILPIVLLIPPELLGSSSRMISESIDQP